MRGMRDRKVSSVQTETTRTVEDVRKQLENCEETGKEMLAKRREEME